jgi:hypothetical protein
MIASMGSLTMRLLPIRSQSRIVCCAPVEPYQPVG